MSDDRSSRGTMSRRAMLQSLASTAGAGFVLPFIPSGHPMHEHLADQSKVATADAKAAKQGYAPAFLDRHQLETLEILADRIVPGSTKARVAPFLDSLLSIGAATSQRQLLGDLGAFDQLAIERHEKPWKRLTPAEQDELLTYASTTNAGVPDATIRNYFDDLRGWIAGAYYSSEIGMRELGWTGQVMFDQLPGCEHPAGHHLRELP
jgi:hypothetical protein